MFKYVQTHMHTHTPTLMCFTHSIDPVFSPSVNMMWNKSYKYKKKKEREREKNYAIHY